MAAGSEDDLICDFAEYYHVFSWRGLPLPLAATLARGLPDSSRSKCRLNGLDVPLETMLLAMLADQMARWLWWNSEDGQNGQNPPRSILDILMGKTEPEKKVQTFQSGEEFMKTYKMITGEG